ncbi:hypothetical protein Ddye_016717 [Dipteronia dyeriana]|uniref:Uncharacterized protein n=1 Tax=Dipteronia dyeriana TaxID=168575 RepID=A0AAD9U7X8_9ROSI|nr:hypothetical protein Ddye_016717 [Dipteronia dyeriana]
MTQRKLEHVVNSVWLQEKEDCFKQAFWSASFAWRAFPAGDYFEIASMVGNQQKSSLSSQGSHPVPGERHIRITKVEGSFTLYDLSHFSPLTIVSISLLSPPPHQPSSSSPSVAAAFVFVSFRRRGLRLRLLSPPRPSSFSLSLPLF